MPRAQYILALDQGTTSSRAVLFDHTGTIRGIAQKTLTSLFPQPGWVEQDANEIWSSQAAAVTAVLAQASLSSTDVSALGITNQRETTLVWDRETGQPIYNAIVWQDRRTAPLCDTLRQQGLETFFRDKTGLVIDPYFSGTKIRWLLDTVPGARAKAEAGRLAFGTVDTWLVWQLTRGKQHITDVTNASRTLLLNIQTGEWDQDLLDSLDIPRQLLPEVRSSSQVYAETSTDLFATAVPISGLAGDQHAALFWSDVHDTRHGKKHVWHGLLHAHADRRAARCLSEPSAHHRRLAARRPYPVCAGRQRLYGRSRCAVAA